MKKLILGVVLLGLLGCDAQSDGKPAGIQEICIKGVKYYRGLNTLTPAFSRDSKVILCQENTYE